MLDIIIGSAAGLLVHTSSIPQLIHNYKTKSTADLSWMFMMQLVSGLVLYSIYAYLKVDAVFFIGNTIGLGFWCFIVFQKWLYSRH